MHMRQVQTILLLVLTYLCQHSEAINNSCDNVCVRASQSSKEALRSWLTTDPPPEDILLRVQPREICSCRICSDYYPHTQWVLAKDSKAVYLMKLPGLYEMIYVQVFPSLMKIQTFIIDMEFFLTVVTHAQRKKSLNCIPGKSNCSYKVNWTIRSIFSFSA